jgi:hypothetical protein
MGDAEATTTLPISEHECLPETREQGQGGSSRNHTLSTTMEDPSRRSFACGLCLAAVCSTLGGNARSAAECSSLSWTVILWSLRLRSHEMC